MSGIGARNLIGYVDEVIFGNCVSFEEMVGKPNFRHKISSFQLKPCVADIKVYYI